MRRALFITLAALVGGLAAAVVFLAVTSTPFFAAEAYADANEWFGLSIIGDLELAFPAFLLLFGVAAFLSDSARTFWLTAAGVVLASIVMAGLAIAFHPAPRSLHTDYQLYAVGLWWGLSLLFALTGQRLAKRIAGT